MTGSRWRLILNGKSHGDEAVREAVQACRSQGIDLDVRVTWEEGDAARFAAEVLGGGLDALVAAGGDGTLGQVAAVLAASDEPADALPALGLVALGTANDFAAAAEIPEEVDAAFELVRTLPAHPVDILRIEANDRVHWSINLASGGFGTEATTGANEGLKDMFGGLAYLIGGMSKLGRIEPIAARVHAPGFEWTGAFIALGIGNGRRAGGGMGLCPEALIDDGLLDLTIVPELEGEVAATVATLLREGSEAALARVAVTARLPWVEIESPQPFCLNLDGEPVEARHFRVECVARRLRMHLPAGCPLLGLPGNPAVASGETGQACGDPDEVTGLLPA
ncbi:lipid kinase YegS [Luteimonas vadosa]|uniref:Lipid kinase YegS n=1 Tax=Luteimonas vadosa TaxID=1165507 RepID=A0ABP9DQH1_9GAMM